MTKAQARIEAQARRQGCNPNLGVPLAGHVLRLCPPPPGAVVAGYYAMRAEIDIVALLRVLHVRGHVIVLPETMAKGEPLVFRRWDTWEPLLEGRFGTRHPGGEVLRPDFLLVPLLGFDNSGNRLGYGAGHYDRTFADLPDAFRLGCAFSVQQFAKLPVEAHDVRLHAVATEAGVLRFS
jgi:5-formyltetrahydrofolate cyclo-ligase